MKRSGFLFGAASGLVASRAARAQAPPTIRIGVPESDPYMQPYYAQNLGLFARAGVSVDIEQLGAFATLQGVIGGSLDIANTDNLQVASARARGVDIVIIAAGAYYDSREPTIVLVVPPTSSIRTARDLVGKTIAVPSLSSNTSMAINEWLRKGGTDPAAVRMIEVPFSGIPVALERGNVDCGVTGEPELTEDRAHYRVLAYPFGAIADKFYTGTWVASGAYADANPALMHKLIDILYTAGRWANTHRAESAVIESQLTKIPLDVMRVMARNVYATSLEARYAQPLLDAAYRNGLLKTPVAAATLFWKGLV